MTKDDEENRRKSRSSFGWGRLESVGSLCTLVFLGSLCFGTAIEALQVSHNVWKSLKMSHTECPSKFWTFKCQGDWRKKCGSLFTFLRSSADVLSNWRDISGDFSTLCWMKNDKVSLVHKISIFLHGRPSHTLGTWIWCTNQSIFLSWHVFISSFGWPFSR